MLVCEEGNKAAFQIIKESIEDASIGPELSFLSIIPDVPHVGKTLKAGFSNWYLKVGNERSNLAVIRSLRNRSTDNTKQAVRNLIPRNDHVRNRDRQDPSAVLSLTSEPLLAFLSRTGPVSTTIIPETSNFTADNRPGMYPKPVSVAVGSYGWLYFLCNYDETNGKSDLIKARLHSLLYKFVVIKKQVLAREVHFRDGIVYLCAEDFQMTIVDEEGKVDFNVKRIKSEAMLKEKVQEFGLPVQDTVAQMKESLILHKNSVQKQYNENEFEPSTINFWCSGSRNQPKFSSVYIVDNELLYAACTTESAIVAVTTSLDGVNWKALSSLCIVSGKMYTVSTLGIEMLSSLFVWLTMHEMVAMHSKSEKEAPTSSSVIHRTARYTSTPSSHLLWNSKILLVVVTKTAWTALLLNATLDSHVESTSNLTIGSLRYRRFRGDGDVENE